MKKLINRLNFMLVCLFIFTSCTQSARIDHKIKNTAPIIVMHKGLHFSGIAPTNSLDAIQMAHRAGAKSVELDFWATKDQQVVLASDLYLNNTHRSKSDYAELPEGLVLMEHSLAELQEKYVYKAANPSMRRPMPTLKDALQLCHELGLYVFIEIKEYPHKREIFKDETLDNVYQEAIRIMGRDNFALTSLNLKTMEYYRKKDKTLSLYNDLNSRENSLYHSDLNYFPHFESIDEEAVSFVKERGLAAVTWTVPKEKYDSILSMNLDVILTDEIAPNYDNSYSIYSNYSDGLFSDYNTDGQIENSILHLNKGENAQSFAIPSQKLYFGAIYFTVEAKGKFKIEATNFDVERENKGDDFKSYRFQYLLHNQQPEFKITALEDNVEIKSIWLTLTNY